MNSKPRKWWLAGILTFLTIGLGHIYSGRVKKGIGLYFGQYLVIFFCTIFLFIYPSPTVLSGAVIFAVAYFLYCLINAIQQAKGSKSDYELKNYNRWYVYVAFLIMGAFLIQPLIYYPIKKNIIHAYKISAGSLKPTLLVGDRILAKMAFEIKTGVKKGDLVIFPYPEDPSKDFIKRVIAVGGETIEIRDKKVIINGGPIDEPHIIHTGTTTFPNNINPRDNFPPVIVPEDSLFVMGDNRDNSHDSRFWGFVKKSSVKGKALMVYWSRDKENSKIRWDRIGKPVN